MDVIKVLGAGKLDSLESHLRGQTTNDKSEVVRRARGRTQALHLLNDKFLQTSIVQKSLGLLVQESLVGGTTSFSNKLRQT